MYQVDEIKKYNEWYDLNVESMRGIEAFTITELLQRAFSAGVKAAEQSVQPTLLTRCPKCNAVTGWHNPLCEDYLPESQSA